MRYLYNFVFVIGLLILLPHTTKAANYTADDFVTIWDTENIGSSSDNQITIPGISGGYNYSIYFESLSSTTATGTIATTTSASQTITFPEAGQYRVVIKGVFPRIYFYDRGDKLKILAVEQWGNNPWSNMENAFFGCANLTVPATDAPDLKKVTSMANMFRGASSFNQPINHWDVSNVITISSLFQGSSFNQPIDNWNVGRVEKMVNVFKETSFNQPLNNWDVSRVNRFSGMFKDNTSFNQDLSNWNTASVTTMWHMFYGATAFDQDLSAWNITSIVASTTDYLNGLEDMFLNAGLSQQNLDDTLVSWAGQPLNSNILFHLGLKTYSDTGKTALNTIRNTYNWTISEQYQAKYRADNNSTLNGSSTQSYLGSGSTTEPVSVIPNSHCTFIKWSDGRTDNPRSDIISDNITVSAETKCPETGRSGGKIIDNSHMKAGKLFSPSYQSSPVLEIVIAKINTLAADSAILNDPESKQQFIAILQQLLQILKVVAGEK